MKEKIFKWFQWGLLLAFMIGLSYLEASGDLEAFKDIKL
jgi:hypothetical protein